MRNRSADEMRTYVFGEELTANHNKGATVRLAPELNKLVDGAIFEGVWQLPHLELKLKSLVTISGLAAVGHERELGFHMRAGLRNGLTQEMIVGAIMQLAFYIGLPRAHAAIRVLDSIVSEQADSGASDEK